MKIIRRAIDQAASNPKAASAEMPNSLVCIHRALMLAEVPGIRCTNQTNGEQLFELARGTPVSLYLDKLADKARKGEPLPSPREVLAVFGRPCFSALPCGAPIPFDNSGSCTPTTTHKHEKNEVPHDQ